MMNSITHPQDVTAGDRRWSEEKARYGWNLPFIEPIFLRLPIIRDFRAWLFEVQLLDQMDKCGMNLIGADGNLVPGYYAWVHYAIKRGWC